MSGRAMSLASGLIALVVVPNLWAADACMVGAKAEYGECKTTCKEDFQVAKDGCLDRDHACVEVCRAEREE